MTYRLFYVSNYLMDKYNKDIIAINDVGGKSPNYDAYGLFRALHSHNPTQLFAYRGIVIPLLGSYWGGSQGLSSTYEQAHVDLDLLTLAS